MIDGVRAFDREEFEFARDSSLPAVLGSETAVSRMPACLDRILDACPPSEHISFDVDGLGPSVLPLPGTPVPGGIGWYDALALIRAVARQRQIVGIDAVEFAPIEGLVAPDSLTAQLANELIGGALLAQNLGIPPPRRSSEEPDSPIGRRPKA